MGKSALDELNGVHKVTSGFHRGKEINTVSYDAEVVTPEEMITALKNAGTYIGTADDAE